MTGQRGWQIWEASWAPPAWGRVGRGRGGNSPSKNILTLFTPVVITALPSLASMHMGNAPPPSATFMVLRQSSGSLVKCHTEFVADLSPAEAEHHPILSSAGHVVPAPLTLPFRADVNPLLIENSTQICGLQPSRPDPLIRASPFSSSSALLAPL